MTQGLQGPPRETFGFWDALGLLRLIFFFAIYAGYQYYNYGTIPFGLEKTIWHYTEKYIIGEKVPFEKQIPSNAPELQVSFVKQRSGTHCEPHR